MRAGILDRLFSRLLFFLGGFIFYLFAQPFATMAKIIIKKKERRDPDSKVQSKGDMENSRS
jgi:hypothetical protein